jgi:hypothetical protein
MILKGVVQICDVSLMVLAMVNLHGLGINMRLKSGIIVRQWRQCEFTHWRSLSCDFSGRVGSSGTMIYESR